MRKPPLRHTTCSHPGCNGWAGKGGKCPGHKGKTAGFGGRTPGKEPK